MKKKTAATRKKTRAKASPAPKPITEAERWQAYRSIPKKHWREMSGRQAAVLHNQADLYGVPLRGRHIDLSAVVRWLHDFLAERKHDLNRQAPPKEVTPNTPALERKRMLEADKLEIQLEELRRRYVSRDELREGWSRIAAILRRAGESLQRQHGAEAHQILEDALDDADQAIEQAFEATRHGQG